MPARAGGGAGDSAAGGSSQTKVPRPTTDTMNPELCSSSKARTMVLRWASSSRASVRVGGSRKPGGKAPLRTRSITWSTICR